MFNHRSLTFLQKQYPEYAVTIRTRDIIGHVIVELTTCDFYRCSISTNRLSQSHAAMEMLSLNDFGIMTLTVWGDVINGRDTDATRNSTAMGQTKRTQTYHKLYHSERISIFEQVAMSSIAASWGFRPPNPFLVGNTMLLGTI